MAAEYELLCTVSKQAYDMIKAGKAVFSSGGVRSLTGQLIEMAKPIASSTIKNSNVLVSLGPHAAAVNVASSLINNVQSGALQHSLNLANVKLDTVITQLGTLSNAMQGLQQVKVLSWVNSAFSLANCGISVAGFYVTLNKLDHLHGQLGQFSDLYKQESESNHIESYQNYLMHLKNHLNYLQERYKNDTFNRQSFLQREATIENDLTHTENFLRKIIKTFKAKNIDGKIGCQIIFTLSIVYAQTVNEFCCQYFYEHGIAHSMFNDWISVLDEIDSPDFREFLKKYFIFDREYITVSPKLRNAAYQVLFESIIQQKNRLMLCSETIKHLPKEQYIHMDDLLSQEVFIGILNGVSDFQNNSIDDIITRHINTENCWINDNETVTIPLMKFDKQ